MASLRRIGAAGVALGLCIGAAGMVPASADVSRPAPVAGGLLGAVDGGLLGGLLNSLLNGEGGLFGHEGGFFAGDDTLGDVVGGFAGSGEVVGAVGDVVATPSIGGQDSFGGSTIGTGLPVVGGVLNGVLGGLLSNGAGLLGGAF